MVKNKKGKTDGMVDKLKMLQSFEESLNQPDVIGFQVRRPDGDFDVFKNGEDAAEAGKVEAEKKNGPINICVHIQSLVVFEDGLRINGSYVPLAGIISIRMLRKDYLRKRD